MRAGSLHNKLYDEAAETHLPEAGMGATVIFWTNRKAGTIEEVSTTGHRFTVREDRATGPTATA